MGGFEKEYYGDGSDSQIIDFGSLSTSWMSRRCAGDTSLVGHGAIKKPHRRTDLVSSLLQALVPNGFGDGDASTSSTPRGGGGGSWRQFLHEETTDTHTHTHTHGQTSVISLAGILWSCGAMRSEVRC